MEPQYPIVVIDSGVGGLSTLQACRRLLPQERYYFFGDTAFAPYGDKTKEQVRARIAALAEKFFQQQQAKALVLACNTATSAAASYLRQQWPDRIILGLEPALKPAVEQYGDRSILVLATALTIGQEKFQHLYETCAANALVTPLPCPGLMELVEQEAGDASLNAYLRQKIGPGEGEGLVLVLGCTHYVFLRPLLAKLYPKAIILDGNEGAARHLDRLLRQKGLQNTASFGGSLEIGASQDAAAFERRCHRFLAKLT